MGVNEDERTVNPGAARMGDEEEAKAEERVGDGGGEALSDPAAELARLQELADSHYKSWQRSAADFQNFKRRVEQERSETARFASVALVLNLLPVFDDLDRAVATIDANLAGLNWVQGIVAIHRKFANLLQAMEVSEIKADGETFDPARHEAVSQSPGEEGRVLHVVQKGYQLGDRVIRPAMVIVGQSA